MGSLSCNQSAQNIKYINKVIKELVLQRTICNVIQVRSQILGNIYKKWEKRTKRLIANDDFHVFFLPFCCLPAVRERIFLNRRFSRKLKQKPSRTHLSRVRACVCVYVKIQRTWGAQCSAACRTHINKIDFPTYLNFALPKYRSQTHLHARTHTHTPPVVGRLTASKTVMGQFVFARNSKTRSFLWYTRQPTKLCSSV